MAIFSFQIIELQENFQRNWTQSWLNLQSYDIKNNKMIKNVIIPNGMNFTSIIMLHPYWQKYNISN
jgi:hypothetical protein